MTDPMLRVLLIEDDEDDYLITEDLLAEASPGKTRLTWHNCLDDGLAALHRESLMWPWLTRLGPDSDLIQQAKNEGITTLLILLTGQGDEELDARAVELGAADYLVKGRSMATPSAQHSLCHRPCCRHRRPGQQRSQYRLLFGITPRPCACRWAAAA